MSSILIAIFRVTLLICICVRVTYAHEFRMVGYVPTWSDIPQLKKTLPTTLLTHVHIAFSNPIDDTGTLSVPKGMNDLVTMAKQNNMRVLISLGGGFVSTDPTMKARYAALLSPEKRSDFVKTIATYLAKHHYDGVDIDLEGPAITDAYGDFIAELATALRAQHKLLTAAFSSQHGGNRVPAATLLLFSYINVMAYDATGPWNPARPGPHASIDFAKRELAYWRQQGVPANRLVLGIPCYGYRFNTDNTVSTLHYRTILEQHPEAEAHDAIDSLFYNGQPAIRAKAALIRTHQLGGAMFWSVNQDVSDKRSLIRTMGQALKE